MKKIILLLTMVIVSMPLYGMEGLIQLAREYILPERAETYKIAEGAELAQKILNEYDNAQEKIQEYTLSFEKNLTKAKSGMNVEPQFITLEQLQEALQILKVINNDLNLLYTIIINNEPISYAKSSKPMYLSLENLLPVYQYRNLLESAILKFTPVKEANITNIARITKTLYQSLQNLRQNDFQKANINKLDEYIQKYKQLLENINILYASNKTSLRNIFNVSSDLQISYEVNAIKNQLAMALEQKSVLTQEKEKYIETKREARKVPVTKVLEKRGKEEEERKKYKALELIPGETKRKLEQESEELSATKEELNRLQKRLKKIESARQKEAEEIILGPKEVGSIEQQRTLPEAQELQAEAPAEEETPAPYKTFLRWLGYKK